MMRKHKRGFTLIELLAVIVILAIIALIATPIIIGLVDNARKEVFKETGNNIIKAAEDTCQIQRLKREEVTTTYIFTDGVASPSINMEGTLPTSGIVTVNQDCNVALNITNGKFTATKGIQVEEITVVDGNQVDNTVYDNGTIVYFNPVTATKCTVTDYNSNPNASVIGTKTGCMKWYTFNDDGKFSSNINMILDHNTTSQATWTSTGNNIDGPGQILTSLASDTSGWSNTLSVDSSNNITQVSNAGNSTYTLDYTGRKARLIAVDEIARITGNTGWKQSSTSSITYYFDTNSSAPSPTCTNGDTSACHYGWLYDRTSTDCTTYGCLNNSTTTSYGYWTSSSIASSTIGVWWISYLGGRLNTATMTGGSSNGGIRPVITVPKSLIK